MIEYNVKVVGRSQYWKLDGELHCEHGPAVIYFRKTDVVPIKAWYLNGLQCSENTWEAEMVGRKNPTCDGKIVEIDGVKYALKSI